MPNRSYCRFENTSNDLADCVRAIENGETNEMSSYEYEGLKRLRKLAARIVKLDDDIVYAIERHEEEAAEEEE